MYHVNSNVHLTKKERAKRGQQNQKQVCKNQMSAMQEGKKVINPIPSEESKQLKQGR